MAKKKRLLSYHFSAGNSSCGPIGFCARVLACSKQQAIERLLQALPSEVVLFDDLEGKA